MRSSRSAVFAVALSCSMSPAWAVDPRPAVPLIRDLSRSAAVAESFGPAGSLVYAAAVFMIFADAAASAFGAQTVSRSIEIVTGWGREETSAPAVIVPVDERPEPAR